MNVSDKTIAFFKPDLEYANYGLIGILLKNVNTHKQYRFDNGGRGDLDNIFLKQENYVLLNKDESFCQNLKLSINQFTPKISKGKYEFEFVLDYGVTNFTFPCEMKAAVFRSKSSRLVHEEITL
jgi:hypothetical protein